jgi:hypothetical protein
LIISGFILALVVNLIFILFVFTRKNLRTGFNVLLANIAIADIVKSLMYFVFQSSFLMNYWVFGDFVCSSVGSITLSYTFFIPFSLTSLFVLSFIKSVQFDLAILLSIFTWIVSLLSTKFDSEVQIYEMSEDVIFSFCTVSYGFIDDNLEILRWIFLFTYLPPIVFVFVEVLSKYLEVQLLEGGENTKLAALLAFTSIIFNEYLLEEFNIVNFHSLFLSSKHVNLLFVYLDFVVSFHRPFLYLIMKKDVKNEFQKIFWKETSESRENLA